MPGKAAFSWSDKLTIEKKNDDHAIDAVNAVWLATIINEVSSTSSNNSSKHHQALGLRALDGPVTV